MANLVCLIPLGYICAAANFGMFNFKFFSLYQLHTHNQTAPSHLLWSALLLTRLSYGVAYNFLQLVDIQSCAFFDVMGPLSQVDFLGAGFNAWGFTTLLFLMVLLTVTDCWSRMLNFVGLPQYGLDDDFSEQQLRDGKAMIDRARRELKERLSGVQAAAPASGSEQKPRAINQVDIER